jgi:iron complex outermembrane recepter protein
MRSITTLLLSSTAFFVTPALAQEMQPAAPENTAEEAGEIVVFGRGETRQVQELDQKDLAIQAPGTSPLKAIERLPSVNFQSADPFGNYEWSTRVTIRGFNQNQLGFNLDGIPLGDMTYGNNNGLHISRAIAPENIGLTRVFQGAGSIGTQSTNNLGGTLEFFSLNPKDVLASTATLLMVRKTRYVVLAVSPLEAPTVRAALFRVAITRPTNGKAAASSATG